MYSSFSSDIFSHKCLKHNLTHKVQTSFLWCNTISTQYKSHVDIWNSKCKGQTITLLKDYRKFSTNHCLTDSAGSWKQKSLLPKHPLLWNSKISHNHTPLWWLQSSMPSYHLMLKSKDNGWVTGLCYGPRQWLGTEQVASHYLYELSILCNILSIYAICIGNECCCLHTVDISNVKLYNQKYPCHQSQYSKIVSDSKCLAPVAQ